MANRLIDLNPLTGEAVWFTDNHDGTFAVTHTQDTTPVIEHNKALANHEERSRKGIKDGWWHYASIPNIVIQKWNTEINGNILDRRNAKELFKRLNHPDYKYLRSTHGKHTVKQG